MFVGIIVVAVGIVIYIGFRRGWFGSSADVVQPTNTSDISGQTNLQKGAFDQTEVVNGLIKLKVAQ